MLRRACRGLLQAPVLCRGAKRSARGAGAADLNPDEAVVVISRKEYLDVSEYSSKMDEHLLKFRDYCDKISLGRANPRVLDSVQLKENGGSKRPLSAVAQVTVRDPQTLQLTLSCPSLAAKVSSAILEARLGLNPVKESPNVFRVPIPRVTMDTREQLIKGLKKSSEDVKTEVREVFSKATRITAREKIPGLSKEDERRKTKDLETLVKKYLKEVEDTFTKKAAEIKAF